MELGIRRVLYGFLGLFLLLELWLGYWVVYRGPALEAHVRNPRLIAAEMRVARGGIKDRHGEALAESVWENGRYRRHYVGPLSAAHTVGYVHSRFGKSGLEKAYDADLRGETVRPSNFWASMVAKKEGLEIVTTLDSKIQRAAEKALAGRPGAVVVLDAETGAILAAASSPYFDPGSMDPALFSSTKGNPLYNRALQGRYPPGSAFKPLILAAALESKAVTQNQTFQDRASIVVQGYEIGNYEGKERGRIDLRKALAYSSNVVFVEVGMTTGGNAVRELASRMGILADPELRIPASASHLPSTAEMKQASVLAEISIGQGGAWVSPLHMAVIAATIGNGGFVIKPYLVQSVGGESVAPTQAHTRVLSEKVAGYITEAMQDVVRYGTGTRAAVSGTTVAGKTGTADNPNGKPHAWFIGFAPHRKGMVAVAIVLENAGFGGGQAAPVAAKVVQAVVQEYGNAKSTKSR